MAQARGSRFPVAIRGMGTALAFTLLGCAGLGVPTGGPPVLPTAPTVVGGSAPARATEPSGTRGAPVVPGAVLDPAVPTACLALGDADCARARDMAAPVLEDGDPPVRYVQVGPFGCLVGDRCALSLPARPEGDVVIEFDGGDGITVHVTVAADGSFEAVRGPTMGVSVEPVSAPGSALRVQPFALGHCGIFSGIDVDGAWWDPVGPVPM
ncbi:MAG: hypothetical protein ABIQ58_09090, partial [Candidatus Limnocylindrales bacterium]